MTSFCPFDDLPERIRRENNWLIRNYHGIEWFETSIQKKLYDTSAWHYTAHTLYQRMRDYLSNLFSRNVYNLEGISPSFKNLLHFEDRGQRCTHHRFRTSVESHCALRNAYKLKRWLTIRNSSNSSYECLSLENWSESDFESKKTDSGNFLIQLKNQKHNHSQHWSVEKKYIDKKTNQNENKQATDEEKQDLPKFDSPTGRDKANINVS